MEEGRVREIRAIPPQVAMCWHRWSCVALKKKMCWHRWCETNRYCSLPRHTFPSTWKKIIRNWHFHNCRFLRIDLFAKQPDIASPWSAATHFFCSAARTLSPPASNFAPWRRIISLFRGRLSSLGLVSKTSILKLWLKSDFRFHATKFYDNLSKI